jgi:hypothetical protein
LACPSAFRFSFEGILGHLTQEILQPTVGFIRRGLELLVVVQAIETLLAEEARVKVRAKQLILFGIKLILQPGKEFGVRRTSWIIHRNSPARSTKPQFITLATRFVTESERETWHDKP